MKKRMRTISHDEVKKAIATYLAHGGRILELPAQKAVSIAMVGRRWSHTEIDLDYLN